MTNRYFDLIDQTFYFPQEGFNIENNYLTFNEIPLKYLIGKYGTPLKLTYLPKIGDQIKRAKNLFNRAIKTTGYAGKYHYCYCTKSNHFSYVLHEVLDHDAHLETSSEFDIDLIRKLEQSEKLTKSKIIVCNGYKTSGYQKKIVALLNDGYKNCIPVCDNKEELDYYAKNVNEVCKLGIRVATEEEPNFSFYTSRLGIRHTEVLDFYKEKIADNPKVTLKMLHFFVDNGIRDKAYYWGELKKALKLYCELKKLCPDLNAINIGGGLPIRDSLGFEFDYKYMIKEIVNNIQQTCEEEEVAEPDIFTEFGSYTVGESGAIIFSILGQKRQNDSELWYMIDNSLMTTIPDAWGMAQNFILLPINKWNNEYTRVNIGGLTCDNADFYNSEAHDNQLFLPQIGPDEEEPLYIGFFHTGAYQDSISGYGGIKHCLIPSPKHIIIDRDEKGNLTERLYQDEQSSEDMLKILGY